MILFIILTLMALGLAIFVVLAAAVGGTIAVVVFGDVIVCIVFIVLLLRYIYVRRM